MERESKTARKMAQVKERRGGGKERKETILDKRRDIENRPLANLAPTFDAINSYHTCN